MVDENHRNDGSLSFDPFHQRTALEICSPTNASYTKLPTGAVQIMESSHNITGEFQMLSLILSHRHLCSLVEDDIGCHEHRVGKQANADRFTLLLGFVLELDHSLQPVHGCHTIQ